MTDTVETAMSNPALKRMEKKGIPGDASMADITGQFDEISRRVAALAEEKSSLMLQLRTSRSCRSEPAGNENCTPNVENNMQKQHLQMIPFCAHGLSNSINVDRKASPINQEIRERHSVVTPIRITGSNHDALIQSASKSIQKLENVLRTSQQMLTVSLGYNLESSAAPLLIENSSADKIRLEDNPGNSRQPNVENLVVNQSNEAGAVREDVVIPREANKIVRFTSPVLTPKSMARASVLRPSSSEDPPKAVVIGMEEELRLCSNELTAALALADDRSVSAKFVAQPTDMQTMIKNEFKRDAAALTALLQSKDLEISSLKHHHQRDEEQIAMLLSEVGKSRRSVQEMQMQLFKSEDAVIQLSQVRSDLGEALHEVETRKEQLRRLESEGRIREEAVLDKLNSLKLEVTQKNEEMSKQSEQIKHAKMVDTVLGAECQRLDARLRCTQDELDKMILLCENLRSENSQQLLENSTHQMTISSLQERLAEKAEIEASLRSALLAEADLKQKSVLETRERYDLLHSSYKELEASSAQSFEEWGKHKTSLESDHEKLACENESLNELAAAQRIRIEELSDINETLQKSAVALTDNNLASIKERDQQIRSLESIVTSLRSSLEDMEKSIAELSAEKNTLSRQLSCAEEEVLRFEQELRMQQQEQISKITEFQALLSHSHSACYKLQYLLETEKRNSKSILSGIKDIRQSTVDAQSEAMVIAGSIKELVGDLSRDSASLSAFLDQLQSIDGNVSDTFRQGPSIICQDETKGHCFESISLIAIKSSDLEVAKEIITGRIQSLIRDKAELQQADRSNLNLLKSCETKYKVDLEFANQRINVQEQQLKQNNIRCNEFAENIVISRTVLTCLLQESRCASSELKDATNSVILYQQYQESNMLKIEQLNRQVFSLKAELNSKNEYAAELKDHIAAQISAIQQYENEKNYLNNAVVNVNCELQNALDSAILEEENFGLKLREQEVEIAAASNRLAQMEYELFISNNLLCDKENGSKSLKSQNDALQNEVNHLSAHLQTCLNSLEYLGLTLASFLTVADMLYAKKYLLSQGFCYQGSQLRQCSSQNSDLQSRLIIYANESGQLRNQISELSANLRHVEHEKASVMQSCCGFKAKISQLEVETERMKSLLIEKDHSLVKLRAISERYEDNELHRAMKAAAEKSKSQQEMRELWEQHERIEEEQQLLLKEEMMRVDKLTSERNKAVKEISLLSDLNAELKISLTELERKSEMDHANSENMLSEAKKQLEVWSKDNESLSKELRDAQKNIDLLMASNAGLKQELLKAGLTISDIKLIQEEVEQIHVQFNALQDENGRLSDNEAQMRVEVQHLSDEKHNLLGQLIRSKEIETQYRKVQEELMTLQAQLTVANDEVARLNEVACESKNQIAILSAVQDELRKDLQSKSRLEVENRNLMAHIKLLKDENLNILAIKDDSQKAQAEVKRLLALNSELTLECNVANTDISGAQTEISRLKNELKSVSFQKTTLQQQAGELQIRLQASQEHAHQLTSVKADLSQKLADGESTAFELQRSKSEVVSLQKQIRTAGETNLKLMSQLDKANRNLKQFTHLLDAGRLAKAHLLKAQMEMSELRNQLDALRMQCAQDAVKFNAAQADMKQMSVLNAQLKQRLAVLKGAESESVKARKEIKELQELVRSLDIDRNQTSFLQSELHKIQDEVVRLKAVEQELKLRLSELKAARSDLVKSEDEVWGLRAKVQLMLRNKNQLAWITSELVGAQSVIVTFMEEYEKGQKDFDKSKSSEVEKKVFEHTQGLAEEYNRQMQALEKANLNLQLQLNADDKLREERDSARNELDKSLMSVKQMEEKLAEQHDEQQAERGKWSIFVKQHEQLRARMREMEALYTNSQDEQEKQISHCEGQIKQLSTQIEDKNSKIRLLEADREVLKVQCGGLLELRKREETLEEEKQRLILRIQDVEGRLKLSQESVLHRQGIVAEKELVVREIQADLSVKSTEIEELKAKVKASDQLLKRKENETASIIKQKETQIIEFLKAVEAKTAKKDQDLAATRTRLARTEAALAKIMQQYSNVGNNGFRD